MLYLPFDHIFESGTERFTTYSGLSLLKFAISEPAFPPRDVADGRLLAYELLLVNYQSM